MGAMKRFSSVLAAITLTVGTASVQAAIIINQPSQVSSAAQANGVRPGDFAVPTNLPFNREITATEGTEDGNSRFARSASGFDFTDQRFVTSATHTRFFRGYTLTQTDVLFTPDSNFNYSFTGSSTVSAGTNYHLLDVRLQQGQFGPDLFRSTRAYDGGIAGSDAGGIPGTQTFVVGQGGTVSGSATGTLTGGTTYRLFVSIIGQGADVASPSSGVGTVTLNVPEPTTGVCVMVIGTVLSLARRRRV